MSELKENFFVVNRTCRLEVPVSLYHKQAIDDRFRRIDPTSSTGRVVHSTGLEDVLTLD